MMVGAGVFPAIAPPECETFDVISVGLSLTVINQAQPENGTQNGLRHPGCVLDVCA
jgi:hypothetical protein